MTTISSPAAAPEDECPICGTMTGKRVCSAECRRQAAEEVERLTRARQRVARVHAANRTEGPFSWLVCPVATWRCWQARRDLRAVAERLDVLRPARLPAASRSSARGPAARVA